MKKRLYIIIVLIIIPTLAMKAQSNLALSVKGLSDSILSIPPEPLLEYIDDGNFLLEYELDASNFAMARTLLRKTKDHTFRGTPLVLHFSDGLYNSPDIIALLIEEGINKEHYTEAFLRCTQQSDSVSMHLLLAAGADIHSLTSDGGNALHCVEGNLAYTIGYQIAKLLIREGADVHNKVMLENAWKTPPLLQALAEEGIEPPISLENKNCALGKAAELGDRWTVEYMLARGADVNALCEQTPLIRNAIQGYSRSYGGAYREGHRKIQISSDIATMLLRAGANTDATDSLGRTALHYAAGNQYYRIELHPIPIGNRSERAMGAHGDPAMPADHYHDLITMELVKCRANLNLKDYEGNTPLILAAKNRNHGTLKILLKAKADVKIKNKEGKTLFDYLQDQPSLQIVKEAGWWKSVPQASLDQAFRLLFLDRFYALPNLEELKALIAYGANVNTSLYKDSRMNALSFVIKRMYGEEKLRIAKLLIDNGSNMYFEDNWGETIALYLVGTAGDADANKRKKKMEELKFLIDNGLNINRRNSAQITPLAVAMVEGKKEETKFLISCGAKRDIESEWWYLISAHYHKPEIVSKLRKLVKEGADINAQTRRDNTFIHRPIVKQKGITALMFFASSDKGTEALKALLDMGANIHLKAADGSTALSIAKKERIQENVDLLLQGKSK